MTVKTRAIALLAPACLFASDARANGKGSFAIALERRAAAPRRGRAPWSGSDAISIHSYGDRLGNGHGEGHEFSLTVTLPGAQEFDLIMDTGSPITYVPCLGCPPELCGYHEHQYYDWRVSKDFRALNASTSDVDAAFCDAMPVAHNVSEYGSCDFSIGYVDGSEGGGYMVEDVVTVGDELAPAKMIFGCGGLVEADGRYTRQDGMAGFGRGNTAFHAQLAKAGVIDAHVFGFCSEGSGTDTAMLSLGRYDFGRDLPPLSYTRILGDDDLAVRTMSWRLGDDVVAGSSNVVTVLDSGTTLVLVPTVMFESFKTLLVTQLAATHPELIVLEDDFCFIPNATVLTANVRREWFPKLTITYDPDIHLTLAPENYLYSHPFLPHTFCLGIEESEDDDIILLGQQSLRNTFVEYDLENLRVGVAVARCETLRKKFAPDAPHNPWRFIAIVFITLFTACVFGGLAYYAYVRFGPATPFRYRAFVEDSLDQKIEMIEVAS